MVSLKLIVDRFFNENQNENLNDNEKNFLINCVDFCHDSAITKQALMALTVPKVEKSWEFCIFAAEI